MIKNRSIAKDFALTLVYIFALQNAYGQIDSSTLTLESVFDQVKKYHLMAGRALLQRDFAAAELLKAKGSFDPTAQSTISQKYFANKDYYSLINGEVKIPTWYGIDFKGGYDINRGIFLGNENKTPDNGLWYAGVSVPLGQGLWIDERRAQVKSARIGQNLAINQQQDMTNEVLFQTANVYWDWFRAYHVRQVLNEAVKNAKLRFEAVRTYAIKGDRPGIDTIEASIQVQNINLSLSQAEMELVKATNALSGQLWDENMQNENLSIKKQPIDLTIVTKSIQDDVPKINNNLIPESHPYLEVLRQKLRQLDVEKRLKQDKLKPKLNVQYNPHSEAFGGNQTTHFSINNYKWGMEFKMPLFLRKERGDIKLADLKIQETDLMLREKTNDIQIKFENYITEWRATLDQIEIFGKTVELYKQMLEAERRLFNIGESSLFVVNSREQAYINAQIKLTEIVAKNKSFILRYLVFCRTLARDVMNKLL
ncbi:MAG: TolC family protein [Saprospiraceae bacterium]|nr:TolC family protein [Saprospiraceae bacterium]